MTGGFHVSLYRFSGIADYYNKYNHVESLSPFYHDYNDDDFDLKSSENPTKYIKLHERKSPFSSSKTSIFENITGLSTVLDGIRMGKLHNVLHECSANDISNFFPIMYVI